MEHMALHVQAPKCAFVPVLALALLAGCGPKEQSTVSAGRYKMGDRAQAGNLFYNVIDAEWKTALGDQPNQRVPKNRYLLVRVSITNSGGSEATVPLLSLEDSRGKTHLEESSGEHVSGWLGLIRVIRPAQTEQGTIVFDVPLGAYDLLITDGGEPGQERLAKVEIPLRVEEDPNLTQPPAIAK
jgi:Domain of unknown function (DUF4352)